MDKTRMASSKPSAKSHNLRSVSLPSRPHPTNLKLEDELFKVRSWEVTLGPSLGSVVSGLSRLEELYICLEESLNTASTQQDILSSVGCEGSAVDEILDSSVKVLDICGTARDMVGQVKEHARDLGSAIWRRKWDSPSVVSPVAEYVNGSRKKVKKEAKRLMVAMTSHVTVVLDRDHNGSSSAVRVLRDVNSASIAVFRSLMAFLYGKPAAMRPSSSGWQAITRLLGRRGPVVGCEESAGVNESESVDGSLRRSFLCRKAGEEEVEKMTRQLLIKQLGDLEVCVGSIEEWLECLFRRLIRSRASLLNIISQ